MRKVEIHDVGIPVVRPPIVGWPSSKASKPVPPVPGEGPYLLLEDGSRVLTEDGSGTLLEIGGGGGSMKQYDAEVEYLEMTSGMAYVDTGYIPQEESEIEIYVKFLTNPKSNNLARVVSSSSITTENKNQYGLVRVDTNGGIVMSCFVGSSVSTQSNIVKPNEIVEVYMSQSAKSYTIKVEGKEYNGAFTDNPSFGKPIMTIRIFSDYEGRLFYGKIFGCTIKNYGQLIFDMIPVSKDGIGYMYDRVTGQLFGAQGGGTFTVGPRI